MSNVDVPVVPRTVEIYIETVLSSHPGFGGRAANQKHEGVAIVLPVDTSSLWVYGVPVPNYFCTVRGSELNTVRLCRFLCNDMIATSVSCQM